VAITTRKTVNVGDVAADPRYLTAFATTKSEIIVPVLSQNTRNVLGTIDIESENVDAFDPGVQAVFEACAIVIEPLWHR
jgi:putative methionine-R-sulfoxide reductase with GAF domain